MELPTRYLFASSVQPVREEMEAFETVLANMLQIDEPYLKPLFTPLMKEQGKRLRPLFFFLVQGLFSKPNKKSVPVAVLIELLHTATLIHDDVIDGSSERRGGPTMNALWGDRVSVLMGDYFLARVLQIGVRSPWPRVLEIISPVVMSMVTAELRQEREPSHHRMTEKTYFRIVQDKTAGLFRAASSLGGMVIGATPEQIENLERLGELFGIAFQIQDDILDVSGNPDRMGKPCGQDALNGRWTLPLLFAFQDATGTEKEELARRMRSKDPENLDWIHAFIMRHQGTEKALARCEEIIGDAIRLLHAFKPSDYREGLVNLLVHTAGREA